MKSNPDTGAGSTDESRPPPQAPPENEAQRRRRRAVFLRELAEARELRARVQPRRTKERRLREALRMRTFRI
ncbi:hypothetical protein [Kitasatospora sp. MAP5-34]|uniref:hypothetical protein n=1 Tax=Kitasatospora sp. MAP5-34 TaxID=3035102 RepID=UPI002474B639|nr:hypothetical protein [Kitasatospora sp. MAP5-34]MDH6576272.1 hypothetical protein [Kitasatospora sp. MAP5-34]